MVCQWGGRKEEVEKCCSTLYLMSTTQSSLTYESHCSYVELHHLELSEICLQPDLKHVSSEIHCIIFVGLIFLKYKAATLHTIS